MLPSLDPESSARDVCIEEARIKVDELNIIISATRSVSEKAEMECEKDRILDFLQDQEGEKELHNNVPGRRTCDALA